MQEEHLADIQERISPGGRPIRVRATTSTPPTWVARRRRADQVIDRVASNAKRVVRRWFVPRPAGAPRRFSRI